MYSLINDNLEKKIEAELANSSSTIMELVRMAVDVSVRNRLRAVAEKNLEIVTHYHQKALKGHISMTTAKQRARDALLAQRIGTTGYIYVIDSGGIIRVHPVKDNLGRDVTAFGFIRRQMAKHTGYLEYFWKNPRESNLRPKALYMSYFEPWDWIISASSYRDEFHQLVNAEDFKKSILSQRFGDLGYAFVLDTKGNIVVHPFKEGNVMNIQDETGIYLVREMISRKFGKLHYTWKNPGDPTPRKKILIFNYLPSVNWIVAASAYPEEFNAPLVYLRQATMFVIVAVLLLGLPFSYWIGSSVTRSIKELRDKFATASSGDLTVRMKPNTNDELGHIADYFNGFMDRLEGTLRTLRHEVHERRAAEQGQITARAHMQDIIDSIPSVLIGVDHEQHVTLWNKRAEEVMGNSQRATTGRPISAVCPAYEAFADMLGETLRENRSSIRDKVKGVYNGQPVYSIIGTHPLAGGDGAVVIITDITDRVKIEEVMVQTEKMMSVGGLAAGMAHEINNPLGGILQGTQNILRRIKPGMPANDKAAASIGTSVEQVVAYLDARGITNFIDGIRESGERAARIIANMLEFSRGSEANRAMHDLSSLMEKTIALAGSDYDLSRQYDFKKISISKSYDPALPPIDCSGTEIEQVFLNLLRNAAQALSSLPDDNHPAISITIRKENDWAVITVADNGPGMSEEVRKRIFEPFYTTKKVGTGTGLGLSVSYFIITDNHGGSFTVESAQGQGAAFTIRLPL